MARVEVTQGATMNRCELTELLVSDCAHCRGIKDEPRGCFPARYAGSCFICGEWYTVGDRIVKVAFDSYEYEHQNRSSYVHAVCAEF